MENNNIESIINKGNLELKIRNFKEKAADFGKAVMYTTGALALGLGVIYGVSKITDKPVDELFKGVPTVLSTPALEYVVKPGDGYSTIAERFRDGTTSEITDAYMGRGAQVGDKIVYDSKKDSFIVYRNGNPLEPSVEKISQPVSVRPQSTTSTTLERRVSTPTPQIVDEDILSYTIPANSGYGPWRVAKELDVSQDDVLRLLEGTQVMGGDKFYKIGNDYLALERGKVRVQTELGL